LIKDAKFISAARKLKLVINIGIEKEKEEGDIWGKLKKCE
jgi:hypothetical protein